MKSYLVAQIETLPSSIQKRNLTREYLQARILELLQQVGAMIPLAFHGGTALRFLYGIPRYSEDLDFALERAPDQYDFHVYLPLKFLFAEMAHIGNGLLRSWCLPCDIQTKHDFFHRFSSPYLT